VHLHEEDWVLEPGDELYIPRTVTNTVRNLHAGTTRWLYGYV
jgi:ribosomal protein L16 Arg81 hydroxylase